MGKVKRGRQKLHQKAVRFTDKEKKEDPLEANESSLPAVFPTKGLFNDIKAIPEHTKPVVTSKKDKRKERHERFLKKLHGDRAVEESIKKAEKRAKTVIVGDMEPLLSALPTLQHLVKETSHVTSGTKKTKRSKHARHALQMSEIEHFRQVLQHPSYQSNPMAAISQHLKIAIQSDIDTKT